jgi:hypothetical protein
MRFLSMPPRDPIFFGPTLAPEGYSILFDGEHQSGRGTKEAIGGLPVRQQPTKRLLGFIAGLNRPLGSAGGKRLGFLAVIMTGRPK